MSNQESSNGQGRAMALNPSAGTHPVTTDPREVAAAGRAGERSLKEFPYYLERYGERGRLFALSDGAWIVTLCANPDTAAITAELSWLAQVLSSRGMPSLLLEKHLEFMEEELKRAVPERADDYGRLAIARGSLREARTRILPESEFESLGSSFAGSSDREADARLPRMGAILVSAVVDEAAGVGRAVASVEEWVGEPGRFSEKWLNAVRATIAAAREKVTERKSSE
jgi:hypothetical protein